MTSGATALSGVHGALEVVIGDLVSVDSEKLTLLVAVVAHAGGQRVAWTGL